MTIDDFTIIFFHNDDGEKIATWEVRIDYESNGETYAAEYHFINKPGNQELKGAVKLLMDHAFKFAEEGERR